MKVNGKIMEQIQMNATDGLKIIRQLVTNNWIAEITGINYVAVSRGMNNTVVKSGKPYYFDEFQIKKINAAIQFMAHTLEELKLFNDWDSFMELRRYGKRIKLSYIFQIIMGKTVRWQKLHMRESGSLSYYGKFTD